MDEFDRLSPLFYTEFPDWNSNPRLVFKFGEHYGYDKGTEIFMYCAQGMFGDVTLYRPERPPITEPIEQ